MEDVEILPSEAEVCCFEKSRSPALSISYSPITNRILAGSDDEGVRLYDIQTRALVRTLSSPMWIPSAVRAVVLAPDESCALIAARENAIQLFTLNNVGPMISRRIDGHDHWVRALALHWPTKRLASAANDSSVRIWDIQTGEEQAHFLGPSRGLAVQINEEIVVGGFCDPVIRIWSISDELAPPIELNGHTDWVTSLSLGTRLLVSGSHDKTARVWDIQTHALVCVLQGHEKSVNTVALCNKTQTRVVTGSNDESVIYWTIENGGSPLLKISANYGFGSIRSITFLNRMNEICFSAWDGSIRIFDLTHVEKQRLLAICAAGHERLGRESSIKRIASRDILSKVKTYLFLV